MLAVVDSFSQPWALSESHRKCVHTCKQRTTIHHTTPDYSNEFAEQTASRCTPSNDGNGSLERTGVEELPAYASRDCSSSLRLLCLGGITEEESNELGNICFSTSSLADAIKHRRASYHARTFAWAGRRTFFFEKDRSPSSTYYYWHPTSMYWLVSYMCM